MALYLIAIGGSGARVVESVVHLASVGLMNEEEIKILFVDPDKSNGNYIRTNRQIDYYSQCRALVWKDGEPCQWMRTKITNLGICTTGAGDNTLSGFFKTTSMSDADSAVTDLFDVLYDKEEQKVNLSEGFRGRPAIGSAFMSQLDFTYLRETEYRLRYEDYLEPWARLLEEIDNKIGNEKVKILLCGSVFGGTGASGLPVIARLLDDFYKGNPKLGRQTSQTGTPRDNLTIGSLLILPYFNFRVAGAGVAQESVYARASEFALNTGAAMRYYEGEMQDVCDVFYCIGDQNRTEVDFSVGGESQANKPHIVEMYSALAVRDFLHKEKHSISEKVVFGEREAEGRVGWRDLPAEPTTIGYEPVSYLDYPDESVVRHTLRAAMRFAFAWYYAIVPELEDYCLGNKSKGWEKVAQIWLGSFFDVTGRDGYLSKITNPVDDPQAATITRWCEQFALWMNNLHKSPGETINLFFMDRVTDGNEMNFGRLVQEDPRSEFDQASDTLDYVRTLLDASHPDGIDLEQVESRGYLGLAKFLYIVCSL